MATPRTLTVPNWSIYDPFREERWKRLLAPCTVHYAKGDPDHGRTVTAFSGCWEDVSDSLMRLAEDILPRIDLRTQNGVHPRLGALDVCPFIGPNDAPGFASRFTERFGVPTVLYERSAEGRSLPTIRQGNEVAPHPRWGVSTVGERGFLIAMNVDLASSNIAIAKKIAREIRKRREAGECGFTGVRALAFPLESREIVQVSMNLTDPDASAPDELLAFIEERAPVAGTELVGVIREQDLARSHRLMVDAPQIIRTTG
ncbi:glutamate formimidoyltransferase [soil metagenome]